MTKKNKLAAMAAADRAHGFSVNHTPDGNRLYRGVICLLYGFLIFCASFGTVGGLLNAFSVSYNEPALFFILLLLCAALAFLHYNKICFNVLYPLIFVIFTFEIMQNRILANSGFQSFVSILYEEYASYFELSAIREATVGNTNTYLTITVAAIFVGFVLALLLNIVVSTHMSVLGTILLTAPILQFGIYIEKYPRPVYFIPLVFSYIAIGILGRFSHYQIPQKKEERGAYQLKLKSGMRQSSYRANGRALLQTTGIFAGISLLFLIVFYPIAQGSASASSAVNSVRKTSDEYVKIYLQNGMAGFFNRYESSGGLSEGRLGGVSSVRPDYQTDLKVTFAPYSYETVYLRAFVGVDYTGNSWSDSKEARTNLSTLYEQSGKTEEYTEFTTYLEANRMRHYMENGGHYAMSGKMEIINIDANENYSYMPYYTVAQDGFSITNHVAGGQSPIGRKYTYEYYPAVTQMSDLTFPGSDRYADSLSLDSDELSYLAAYRDYCYDTYTYVPNNLIGPIEAVIRKTGYGTSTQEKANLVTQYFLKEYSYSMSPGTTPYNEDFIEYFLTQQDQGYCAHFASAATMILRYMGVPARYVEGYVITPTAIAQSDQVDASYRDYLTGTSPIDETGVVELNVTDGSAHAWVEVYSDGFGWVPVDPTPPSDNLDSENAGFWDAFTNLFSVTNPQNAEQQQELELADNNTSPLDNLLASTNHLAVPLLLLLIGLILFYPIVGLARNIVLYVRQRRAFRNGDYAKVAAYHHRKLIFALLDRQMLAAQHEDSGRGHLSFAEKSRFLETFAPQRLDKAFEGDERAHDYIALLEKALYSKNGSTRDELIRLIDLSRQLLETAKAAGRQTPEPSAR